MDRRSAVKGCAPARLTAAIPLLAVADVARGVAFYQRIGFRSLFVADDYAVLARDEVNLHLWRCPDRIVADNTACRIRVEGIDALYAECRAAGALHPAGDLQRTAWNTREFTVLDPQGGAITFAEALPG